jgi:hypothetical protein
MTISGGSWESIVCGLADAGYRVVTGGIGGLMEAVYKGARGSPKGFAAPASAWVARSADEYYQDGIGSVSILKAAGVGQSSPSSLIRCIALWPGSIIKPSGRKSAGSAISSLTGF